jgi:hypothetical protein
MINVLSPNLRHCGKDSQDRQCAYDVALQRVHENIIAVENQYVLHVFSYVYARVYGCVCELGVGAGLSLHSCSLVYPASKALPLCNPRPLWLHHIFLTLSHKWHNFRKKKLWDINTYFDFLYKFYLKHFSF